MKAYGQVPVSVYEKETEDEAAKEETYERCGAGDDSSDTCAAHRSVDERGDIDDAGACGLQDETSQERQDEAGERADRHRLGVL